MRDRPFAAVAAAVTLRVAAIGPRSCSSSWDLSTGRMDLFGRIHLSLTRRRCRRIGGSCCSDSSLFVRLRHVDVGGRFVVAAVGRGSNFLAGWFGCRRRGRPGVIDCGCGSSFDRFRGCIHLVLSGLLAFPL